MYYTIYFVIGIIVAFCSYIIGRRSGIDEVYNEFEYAIHKWMGNNRRELNNDLDFEELCDIFNDMINEHEREK